MYCAPSTVCSLLTLSARAGFLQIFARHKQESPSVETTLSLLNVCILNAHRRLCFQSEHSIWSNKKSCILFAFCFFQDRALTTGQRLPPASTTSRHFWGGTGCSPCADSHRRPPPCALLTSHGIGASNLQVQGKVSSVTAAGVLQRSNPSSLKPPTMRLCSVESGSHYIVQAGFKLMILLAQAPKCWDSKSIPIVL